VKAKNPTYGLGEIGKELGAMWKALGDKEKSKYEVRGLRFVGVKGLLDVS
jgi:hypothetical protein